MRTMIQVSKHSWSSYSRQEVMNLDAVCPETFTGILKATEQR